MNLYRSVLVAAAMAGSLAMIACNSNGTSGDSTADSTDPPDDTSTEAPPAPEAESPPPVPSSNDVWVVGTAKNEKDKDGKPLVGRSYLVVTVPTYIRWDQPEVSR